MTYQVTSMITCTVLAAPVALVTQDCRQHSSTEATKTSFATSSNCSVKQTKKFLPGLSPSPMNRALLAAEEGIGVVVVVVEVPGVVVPHATTVNLVVVDTLAISVDGQQVTAAAGPITVAVATVVATPVVGVITTGGNHRLIARYTPPVRRQLSIVIPFLSPVLVCFPFMQVGQ